MSRQGHYVFREAPPGKFSKAIISHRDFQRWSLAGCCRRQACRRLSAPKYLNTCGRKPKVFMGTAKENCLGSQLGFSTPTRRGICGDLDPPNALQAQAL